MKIKVFEDIEEKSLIAKWEIENTNTDEINSLEDFLDEHGEQYMLMSNTTSYAVDGDDMPNISCPDGTIFTIKEFLEDKIYYVKVDE